MTIIIPGPSALPETEALPQVSVELPETEALPERRRLLDDAALLRLLQDEHPLVRGFAVEQVGLRKDSQDLLPALAALVGDEDDTVAAEAVSILDAQGYADAVPQMKQAFLTAEGQRVAALSSALSAMAPGDLLEAVSERGHLSDQTYAAVASGLGTIESEEITGFLNKALNRAGLLSPERKGALYSAALLSGDRRLCDRVLAYALEESADEASKQGVLPARAALATVAGLDVYMAQSAMGPQLFDQVRAAIQEQILPALPDQDRAAVEEAMRVKAVGPLLQALEPVLSLPTLNAPDPSPRAVARRRRGIAAALIAQHAKIGALELAASALIAAVVAQALVLTMAGDLSEGTSTGMITLAKALDGADPEALANEDEEALVARFADKPKREIRRVVLPLVNEGFRRAATVRRFARALTQAGHGRPLMEAAAEVKDAPELQEAVVAALVEAPAGEAVLVELLTDPELDGPLLKLSLAAAGLLRTERLSVALLSRFYPLRDKARPELVQAVLRCADERALPLLESRAFTEEPEELSYGLLSAVHGAPRQGRVQEILDKAVTSVRDRRRVWLPLCCERCKETLNYGFPKVFVDPQAGDQGGDPAYVGDVRCKACGAEDQLGGTPQSSQILTQYMMSFLQAAEAGEDVGEPPVAPAQTQVDGRQMGMRAALRHLDAAVAAEPESIRLVLHRARVRLILERPGIDEDLATVERLDPGCPEASALRATLAMRDADPKAAARHCVAGLRRIAAPPPPAVYDADSVQALQLSLQSYLLELSEIGGELPDDLDLSQARAKREAELIAAEQAQATQADPHHHHDDSCDCGHDHGDPYAGTKRNAACPCGSGKKYKRCHGKSKPA